MRFGLAIVFVLGICGTIRSINQPFKQLFEKFGKSFSESENSEEEEDDDFEKEEFESENRFGPLLKVSKFIFSAGIAGFLSVLGVKYVGAFSFVVLN